MDIQSASTLSPVAVAPVVARADNRPPPRDTVESRTALPAKAAARPTSEHVQQAVDHSNTVLQAKAIGDLRFTVDKDTKIAVVKLVDHSSGETIMQIPSEDMIKIAKSIDQFIGALVQKSA
jgi:flagellar protein FlaG